MRKIMRADNSGFCFGVSKAVDNALLVKNPKGEIYTFGPLVHNNDVLDKLKQSGVKDISEKEIDTLTQFDVVIIRAHGVPPRIYEKLKEKKVKINDLTCPYVINIQKKVKEYYEKGYKIVILGNKDHPEIVSINGFCNESAYITKTGEVDTTLKGRVCVVSQTTEKKENWLKLINNIAKISKEFVAINTICKATTDRQLSAYNLSKEVDAMIVIGGKESSNTTKLYEICRENCNKTYHVENAYELKDILKEIKDAVNVGVTAGASTPEWIIKEAMDIL